MMNGIAREATSRLRQMIDRREALVPVIALGLLAFGVYVFFAIADEVAEGEIRDFDEWLFLALRVSGDSQQPLGPAWLEEAALEITALGGYALIILAVAVVAGLLIVTRRYGAALYTVVTVSSGALLSYGSKLYFARPRPDLVEHLDITHTASFPSGHAVAITVAYFTLAALVIRFFSDPRVRIYVLCVAVVISILVGLSRVYLGVHWPSDVIAGWALGIAWASLAWLVASALRLWRRRGGAQQSSDPE